ncbi:MAG: beta-galactosidase [Candidatus Zixiibacteriota bacterium]|nr:MAG: beta-galactosidase [candidate division Zixibacteria bacterium]
MLGIIDNKFIIGRDDFFPFSAEMHYFRVEKRYWSICFERIKKAGFKIISTYIPWNLHEENPGNFDFRGYTGPDKDLIVFLELAREFGFKVILKPGPWIKAEWNNGGLPKYLFTDEAVVARDSEGELVSAYSGLDGREGYQPSYLHPKYIGHIKRYISGLFEVIQNYIFPKGPVFILQIDDEVCFGRNLDPFSADYNNIIITEYYHPFLEEKYKEPKNLPVSYGKKIKEFSQVEPPSSIEVARSEDLIKYFDWIEFKGSIVATYLDTIKERLEAHGVGCFFSVNLPWTSDFGLPIDIDRILGEKMIVGMQVPDPSDYCRLGRNLKYLASKTGFSWTPQLYGGTTDGGNKTSKKPEIEVSPRFHRYLIVSSLAAGLKGMNHYMFVGRDHWIGAPLGNDGTVNENYDTVRKINTVLEHIGINTAKPVSKIGIMYYKPYLVQHHLGITEQFPYVNDLVSQNLNPLGQDLMNMKYDYSVGDLDSEDAFRDKDLYFIPVAEYMSEKAQSKIVEAVKSGKNAVLFGLMPKMNEMFKPCKVLSKGLGLTTTPSWSPCNITWDKTDLKAVRYGFISQTGSAKDVAKSGSKAVGVFKKVGKGTVYLFTFDISPKFDAARLNLLKSVFEQLKITSPVSTSDPTVDLVAQVNDRGVILYMVNTDIMFTAPNSDFTKKVVVSVDLASLGIRAAKIKMYDVLDDGILDFSSRELREGVVFPVGYHEAKIFYIPKK